MVGCVSLLEVRSGCLEWVRCRNGTVVRLLLRDGGDRMQRAVRGCRVAALEGRLLETIFMVLGMFDHCGSEVKHREVSLDLTAWFPNAETSCHDMRSRTSLEA